MITIRRVVNFAVIPATFLVATPTLFAQSSIGVNFLGRNAGNTALNPTEAAGFLGHTNWVNLASDTPGYDGSRTALPTSTGGVTGVTFEWDANDSWNSDGGTASPNEKLFKGIQKANPAPDNDDATSYMYFRWRNLPPTATFNVFVYQAHNGANAKAATRINGTTYYSENAVNFGGTFIQATSTTPGSYPIANYVQFLNVNPNASGTIEIEVKKLIETPQLTDGIGVAGMQLELVSGAWPQIQPPNILQDPQDVLSVVGRDVSFSIITDGPWNVEWFTNGVSAVSGAATDYTLTTTAANTDATVYAVVSNAVGVATSQTAVLTLDDPAPKQLIQGFLHVEHYGALNGVDITTLRNDPDFQARNFDNEFYVTAADLVNADEDNFGRLIEGWVVPEVTGSYNFFTRSDDQSELYINPVAGTGLGSLPTNYPVLTPDAFEADCCDLFQEVGVDATTTAAFALTGGQFYGFSALYKDGTGGDFWQMAWREAADGTAADALQPIGTANLWTLASPAGQRADITQHPPSVTVNELGSATFTIAAATLPTPNLFTVQWTIDGTDLPGETGLTYTRDPVTLADNNAVVQARVFTVIGELSSDPATITVNTDVTAPVVISAGFYRGTNVVGILFDEPLDPASATDPFNYIVGANNVIAAELANSDNDVVLLTLASTPSPGDTLQINNVEDRFNNPANAAARLEESTLTPQTLVDNVSNPVILGRAAYLGANNHYVEAGGSDIWNARDAGYMVTTNWTGGFDMRVRVQALEGPNAWTKGGIMIRDTTDGGSRHTYLLTTRTAGENIQTFAWRDTTNGGSGDIGGGNRVGPVPYPNAWLRITRESTTDNVFRSYLSNNGVDWTPFFDHTIPPPLLSADVVLGLAATSHDNGATAPVAEGLFRSFTIEPIGINPVPLALEETGGMMEINWDNTQSWILQTTTNMVTGPWVDIPGAAPPIGIGPTNRVDYYRLKSP